MAQRQIVDVLNQLRPGAEWILQSEDLSKLTWTDKIQTRPTDDEILTAISNYVPTPPPLSLQDQITDLKNQLNALQGK